jgi:hypothetical protein
MKKLFLFSILFLSFSLIAVIAQNTDTTNNRSNVDFKGSSLGDPSKRNEDKSLQLDYKGSSLGDPSRGTTSGSLIFTEGYNVKTINKIEDLNIKWTLKENNSIKKILIVDLTTDDIETIWLLNDYKDNFVNYEKIKSCLLKDFIKEHTYKLNITLNSGENASLEFKYAN